MAVSVNIENFPYFLVFDYFEHYFLFKRVETDFGREGEFDFLLVAWIHDKFAFGVDRNIVLLKLFVLVVDVEGKCDGFAGEVLQGDGSRNVKGGNKILIKVSKIV